MSGQTQFPNLLRTGKIGTMELKNRMVRAPCCTGLGSIDGEVTDRTIRHYKELARGNPGLLIVEYTYIDKFASKSAMCQLGCADNEHIPGLSWLARTIQAFDVKAGIQLEHAGRQKFLGTRPMKAPSRIPWEELHAMGGCPPDEITWEEIQEVVEAFGDAAKRAKLAGFDFVEIHGAHGYLITNFLSPRTNKRTDWYGGSLENRMRFLMQVVANARAKVGDSFPLGVRLSGTEYEPDGVMIEDTVVVAKALEKAGIDVIHVSGGNHHTMHHQLSPLYLPPANNVWAANAVKQVVKIPVIASGSLNTPALAEQALVKGSGDFVGFGRVMFADPYFPIKVQAGLPDEIVPCIRCNDGCQERSFKRFQSVLCTVNPILGNEGMLPTTVAPNRLKVAVVGGGPGGMQAAQTLAQRGHRVTLFERRALGGLLIEGGVPEFKADLRLLNTHLQSRLKTMGVTVQEREAKPEDFASGAFDHVIVAVGAAPVARHFPGSDHPMVVDGVGGVLRSEKPIGKRVVVVGGGLVGCEIGLHLAQLGHQVTIVTRRSDFMGSGSDAGIEVEHSNRVAMGELIERYQVTVRTGWHILGVNDQGAQFSDKHGQTQDLPADSVVLSSGFKGRPEFAKELARLGVPHTAIGDCIAPRKIYDAMQEGFFAAMRIGDTALEITQKIFSAVPA
jgi:2,4-dienoyl-CoA reductase-like NADH-dependent reductase (Old Yellow Enzyme family)/thioredoxin reductase